MFCQYILLDYLYIVIRHKTIKIIKVMIKVEEQFEVSAEVKDLLEVMSQVKSAFDKFNQWETKYRQNKVSRGNDVLGAFSDLQESLNDQLTDLL